MTNLTLTAVEGITVGHWSHSEARTGCTVVVCPAEGCVASGSVLGGAPAGREYALLAPDKTVDRVHAVVLSGGSAFGLASAGGVVRWLEERGRGFETRAGPVPIVPAACIYDLEVGGTVVRPDDAAGYAAADAATADPVAGGRVGVAAGASAGAYRGYRHAVPTGLGSAALRLEGATVAALSVSNPVGDLYDPATGALVAGHGWGAERIAPLLFGYRAQENTTLVVVATDVPLGKAAAAALAMSAHAGIARVTHPSHTVFDGDTTFVLSTGSGPALPLGALSVLVQEVVARALLQGARSVGGRA